MNKRFAVFVLLLIIVCAVLAPAALAASDTGGNDMSATSIALNIGIRVIVAAIWATAMFLVYRSDRNHYYAYHKYMGIPAPKYRFKYIWCGLPYKDWQNPAKKRKK